MTDRPTTPRARKLEDWADRLYRILGEMEEANGNHGGDTEASVRIAWRLTRQDAEHARLPVID